MTLLIKNTNKNFYEIRVFLLFLLFIPLNVFSQCRPDYTIQGDTVDSPGIITLTAGGCSTCTFQWYDDAGNTLDPGPVIHPNVSGKTLFTIYVIDNISGCSNYDPVNDAVDTVWVVVNSTGPVIDPSVFGDGIWNVYCFNDKYFSKFAGYYIDSADFINGSLNINSGLKWASGCPDCGYTTSSEAQYYGELASPYITKAPEDYGNYKVPGYVGAEIQVDNHSISYKRKNFPSGDYIIDINNHDDQCWVLINGIQVFTHDGAGDSHFNIWSGQLDSTSTVEFRWMDGYVSSIGDFRIYRKPQIPAGVWTAFCYNGIDFSNLAGSYTDPNLNINSNNFWNNSLSPSSYSSYQGSPVSNDNHSIKYLRNGFPSGYYSIDVIHDDGIFLSVNNDTVFAQSKNGNQNAVWKGWLDSNSTIEFNWYDNTGGSEGILTFNKIDPSTIINPTLNGGSISDDQIICKGGSPETMHSGLKLSPIKDAYVRSYNMYAWQDQHEMCQDSAYGKKNPFDLGVRNEPMYNDIQQVFISFDLSNVTKPISTAILNIGGSLNSAYKGTFLGFPVYLHAVSDTTWNENTITWNNKPAIGGVLTSTMFVDDGYRYYSWNVTEYVKQKYATGQRKFTFMLKTNDIESKTIHFISKENTNLPFMPPYLAINAPNNIYSGCGKINFQWQSHTASSQNFADIAGANDSTYLLPTVTETTYFRLMTWDNCDTSYSDISRIIIPDSSRGGKIEMYDLSQAKGILKLTGYVGDIIRWESSSDSSFTNDRIVDVNSTKFYSFEKGKKMYVRALVETCSQQDYSKVFELDGLHVYAAFSPNGDEHNQKWYIAGIEQYPTNKVMVYTRWGELVYQVENYNNDDVAWEGKSSSHRELPDGTYFYTIEFTNHKSEKGCVELRR